MLCIGLSHTATEPANVCMEWGNGTTVPTPNAALKEEHITLVAAGATHCIAHTNDRATLCWQTQQPEVCNLRGVTHRLTARAGRRWQEEEEGKEREEERQGIAN